MRKIERGVKNEQCTDTWAAHKQPRIEKNPVRGVNLQIHDCGQQEVQEQER